jgi:branched-chain amino acid transport system ATP-binding protein
MSLLAVQGLTKSFGGLRAVANLDFAVPRGSIVGLIGPNGAGKTTTFSLISGFQRPTAGTVTFKDERITGLSPDAICLRGLTRTFQIMQSFPKLTVLQNVMIGAYARHNSAAAARRPSSGWKSPRRLPPSRNCCCSTRWFPASPRARSRKWSR